VCTNIDVTSKGGGLGNYFNGLYKLVVASASVLAVLQIVIGGFNYISSDAIDNKENGKHQIKNALGGMLLILVSWVILNTINPQLVQLNIVSGPLKPYNLMDFVVMNQKAQDQFDENIKEINKQVTIDKQTKQVFTGAAENLQKLADGYNDFLTMKQLSDKENSGGLTPAEEDRLSALESIYGQFSEEELATIEKTIQDRGGLNGIQGEIQKLKSQAEIIGKASTAITEPKTIAEGSKVAENWTVNEYHTISENLVNKYKNDILLIETAVNNGDISPEKAEQYKAQIKSSVESSISTICEAQFRKYSYKADISATYGNCMRLKKSM
jgi:hypothetical protein